MVLLADTVGSGKLEQHKQLTIDIYPKGTQNVVDIYPKVTYCSFNCTTLIFILETLKVIKHTNLQ